MSGLSQTNPPEESSIQDNEFLAAVSPADLKGRINLRVEYALQKEIEDIAEDTRYPLQSVSEVVRFCCTLGLEKLRQWKPRPTLIGAIKSANALVQRDKIQMDTMDMLVKLDERITWYIQQKAFDEAVSLVAQIRSYFDGIPDDFWKRHILDAIDERFMVWSDRIDAAHKRK